MSILERLRKRNTKQMPRRIYMNNYENNFMVADKCADLIFNDIKKNVLKKMQAEGFQEFAKREEIVEEMNYNGFYNVSYCESFAERMSEVLKFLRVEALSYAIDKKQIPLTVREKIIITLDEIQSLVIHDVVKMFVFYKRKKVFWRIGFEFDDELTGDELKIIMLANKIMKISGLICDYINEDIIIDTKKIDRYLAFGYLAEKRLPKEI